MKIIRITLDLQWPDTPADFDGSDEGAARAPLDSVPELPDPERLAQLVGSHLIANFAGMEHLTGLQGHGEVVAGNRLTHHEERFGSLLYFGRKWLDDRNYEDDLIEAIEYLSEVEVDAEVETPLDVARFSMCGSPVSAFRRRNWPGGKGGSAMETFLIPLVQERDFYADLPVKANTPAEAWAKFREIWNKDPYIDLQGIEWREGEWSSKVRTSFEEGEDELEKELLEEYTGAPAARLFTK